MPKVTSQDRERAKERAILLLAEERALFRAMPISYEVRPTVETPEVEQTYMFRQQFFKAKMTKRLLKIPTGYIHEASGVVLDTDFNIISRNYTSLIRDWVDNRYEASDLPPEVVIAVIEKYLYKNYSLREICAEYGIDYRYLQAIIKLRRCMHSSLIWVLRRFGSIDNYFDYLYKNTEMREGL